MENDHDHRKERAKLYLAPMEGVGAKPFRKAISVIGGFDVACTEFIRVPKNAHVKSLAKVYDSKELGKIPLVAQVMGSDPSLTADMTLELIERGAPRVDLNCGCPSNTVTGRGAGSSLLKTPKHLYEVLSAMKKVASVPISAKLRSGFEDTSLFEENLLAAEAAGASMIALHPRTKLEGYKPPANIELIAKAKDLLQIPVIGNGDILTVEDAENMLSTTRCDGLMIGRGALINPFIFWEIRGEKKESFALLENYLETFVSSLDPNSSLKSQIGQMKQICSFLFKKNEKLLEKRRDMLRGTYSSAEDFLIKVLPILQKYAIT